MPYQNIREVRQEVVLLHQGNASRPYVPKQVCQDVPDQSKHVFCEEQPDRSLVDNRYHNVISPINVYRK